MLDADVDLRDIQIARVTPTPPTTMRYACARTTLDRHRNHILALHGLRYSTPHRFCQ